MFKTQPTTVDGVLSVFNTAIADLQKVAQAQDAIAAKQAQIALDAQAASKVAEAEAIRATKVAEQIKAVFAA
jgi:hypothetical protein